jgi:hypothetical protein
MSRLSGNNCLTFEREMIISLENYLYVCSTEKEECLLRNFSNIELMKTYFDQPINIQIFSFLDIFKKIKKSSKKIKDTEIQEKRICTKIKIK